MSKILVAIILFVSIMLIYAIAAWYKSRDLTIKTQLKIDVLISIIMLIITSFFLFNDVLLYTTIVFFIYTVLIGDGLIKFLGQKLSEKIDNKIGLGKDDGPEDHYRYFFHIQYYFLEILIILFFLYIVIFKVIVKL